MDEKIKTIELGIVNAFLLKAGDGFVLVDTGLPFQWAELDKGLESAGCRPGNLKLVVITHGDWDHIGNCKKLQEKYRAKIGIHPGDAAMAEKIAPLKRKIRGLSARIFFFFRMLHRKMKKMKMTFETFKPDLLFSDGQSLREYGLDAKIIHLPGHTKGSVALLTADGDFFAGDLLVNRPKPDIAIYIDDSRDLAESLNKLKAMNIKMVYPGHGKPFARERLAKIA